VYVQSNNRVRRAVANYLRLGYPNWINNFTAQVLRVPALTSECIAEADVTVATSFQSMNFLEKYPVSKGRKYYLIQHDEGLYHGSRELADHTYRTESKKIVVSSWLRDVLHAYEQEPFLLLNPIDTTQFRKLPRAINDGTIRILLLHHPYLWKGTKEGVEIVSVLKERYPAVRLIMFGTRQKRGLEYAYDEYHYNPPQHKLAELYSNADIFVCPSWDEGFGLPSAEAMACGAALATYDNGGSRDYAVHEKTALVAKRRNAGDLEVQVERLIVDSALRQFIARQGMEYILGMPTWKEQTLRLEKFFST